MKLVVCAKAKGIVSISVTLGERNLLKFVCDLNLHLPLEEDTLNLNLGLVIQMVFCDSVANAFMGEIIKESISPTSEGSALILGGDRMDQFGSLSTLKFGSVQGANPFTEDEIMAVLLQKRKVTTEDLVVKFRARLKSSKCWMQNKSILQKKVLLAIFHLK
ncbi:hypothetical protein AQUCO_02800123v1 [Aquilegia coerulea]|uniref:Uncharacterized protein n=1 Tax=Aquilegia coerulea TaxID=218851 RepID=A0A2G5D3Y2_AQUCA|nr:hypothetical protein AQUCO_02800123v1 [Aquilegia coerulea]